ncbi:unnamed protein product [Brugia pahangi]|uniref:RING-type domain-containing protein n=1 Tax=Brugia pahangi TaxID=6280 RepID=A0A0N4T889_BRUPA|nr:unnamed protein product [Brugia pahangi]
MFRQFPQSQANSNLTPQQSQQQQQTQRASQPFLQQSNSQNNHLITQSSQQINQSLLQSQQISQQQNSTAIQQLLLRLSQQISTLPSQQSLQQTQPMLVQVLQQSSATSEPFRPEQEQQRQQQQQQEHQQHQHHQQQQQQQQQQHSLQQIPQQTSILRPVNRIPVQQIQSTEQSLPLPQQSNQSRSSFDTGLSQERRQMMQQMQSNQSSLSSEQTILQLIQQMFPQISLQPILESRRTNFDNNLLFNQRTQQIRQQQSNEQQQIIQQSPTQPTVQRPLFAQFIPCASIGVSQSGMQTCQQSSRVINDTFEIPQLSLFDLSPQHFMHVIQQCPYNRSSDQQRSVITTQQSSLQPCQELSPGATVSSNQISTSSVLNDTITTSLTNANESEETFTGESYDDDGDNDDNDGDDDNEDNDGDESDNDEESDNFISGAETSTSSTTTETAIIEHMNGTSSQQGATLPEDPETSTPTRPENPRELRETEADNDSPVDMTGIMRHLGSHHTSGPNNNTSTPINNDHLSSSIFAPVHTPTTSLNNQQRESDNSEISDTARSSTTRLLLSRFLNLNEINFTSNNSRNDDVTMQSRNDFYQVSIFLFFIY